MGKERRFFVDIDPRSSDPGSRITLTTEESHHLRVVLRLKVGAKTTLISKSSGQRYAAHVVSLGSNVTLEIENEIPANQLASGVRNMICALPKGDAVDFVIEKCTELGVSRFILWQADRSVVRLTAKELPKKLARYEKIAQSAAKQCNRGSIPEVIVCLSLRELFESHAHLISSEECSLVCSLAPEAKALKTFEHRDWFNLVVGPEGGLTGEEEELLVSNGFQRASLGPLVLRAETAAIASVAMINALFGN